MSCSVRSRRPRRRVRRRLGLEPLDTFVLDHLVTHADRDELTFSARPGLDTASLQAALGVAVVELRPGRYVVHGGNDPALVARLAAWLADHDVRLGELQAAKRSLEQVYLRLTEEEPRDGEGPGDEEEPRDEGESGDEGASDGLEAEDDTGPRENRP
jgi:hypothetical protein